MSQNNPRILLVSHNFPPAQGPESYLVHLNAKSLYRAGFDLTILTTSHQVKHTRLQLDETLLNDLPQEIRVLRTTSYDAWLKAKSPRIGGLSLQLLEKTILPESYMLWLPSAVPTGLNQLAKQPRLIYSRAQKHVSNVCGWRLKTSTGLPWIAHFSDMWADNKFLTSSLQKKIARTLERRILRDADKVIFVTRKTVNIVMQNYPESWGRKISVIPHGYEREIPSDVEETPGSRPLRLIHAGSFYPKLRTPETLFKAMEIVHRNTPLNGRLILTLLGGENENYRKMAETMGLSELIEFKPAVPLNLCQYEIGKSDLLVMIDTLGHDGVFLPSKLIEYFAFKKPILVITEPNSAVSQLLEDCGIPTADQTNASKTAEALKAFLQQWEQGNWQLPMHVQKKLAQFQIDLVNQPLFDLMNETWFKYSHH